MTETVPGAGRSSTVDTDHLVPRLLDEFVEGPSHLAQPDDRNHLSQQTVVSVYGSVA